MGCGSYFCVELKLVEMRVRGRMVIWVRDGRNELQPLPMAINCASIERVKRKESSVRDRNNGDMRVRVRMVIWVRDGRNELQLLPIAINCASIERVKRHESSLTPRH